MLQAAGGPGSLKPRILRKHLQETAFMHDLDPNFSSAWAFGRANLVRVSATADGELGQPVRPERVQGQLRGLGKPLPHHAEADHRQHDRDADDRRHLRRPRGVGQDFVLGRSLVSPAAISAAFGVPSSPPAVVGQFNELTVSIAGGALDNGKYFRFGVDRDEADAFGPSGAAGGNVADLLGASVRIPEGTIAPGGATFDATLGNGAVLRGTFANQLGRGYSVQDGYGFVNAEAAVRAARECRHGHHHGDRDDEGDDDDHGGDRGHDRDDDRDQD